LVAVGVEQGWLLPRSIVVDGLEISHRTTILMVAQADPVRLRENPAIADALAGVAPKAVTYRPTPAPIEKAEAKQGPSGLQIAPNQGKRALSWVGSRSYNPSRMTTYLKLVPTHSRIQVPGL
jgi:hypothetical protein